MEIIGNYLFHGNNFFALFFFKSWKTKFDRVVRNDSTKKLMTGLFEKKRKKKRASGTVKVAEKIR